MHSAAAKLIHDATSHVIWPRADAGLDSLILPYTDFALLSHSLYFLLYFPSHAVAVLPERFVMSSVDFETAVKQEEAYLRKVHPTPDDVPGCMKLFDDFLSCNSTFMRWGCIP